MATNKGGLDDTISPVFGRCQTFTIIEVDGEDIKDVSILPNQYASGVSGVGIQAGQFIAQQGVKVVIAGNFGPNVSAVLSQAGIEMIVAQGKVGDVVRKYINKELKPIQTSQMPFGMGRGIYMPQPFQPVRGISKQQEIGMLEQQMKGLEKQLEQIKKRIEELKE